jgi:hypothetical protein
LITHRQTIVMSGAQVLGMSLKMSHLQQVKIIPCKRILSPMPAEIQRSDDGYPQMPDPHPQFAASPSQNH